MATGTICHMLCPETALLSGSRLRRATRGRQIRRAPISNPWWSVGDADLATIRGPVQLLESLDQKAISLLDYH